MSAVEIKRKSMLTPEDVEHEFCHLYWDWPKGDGIPLCGANVPGTPGGHARYSGQGICTCGKPVCVPCRNLAGM